MVTPRYKTSFNFSLSLKWKGTNAKFIDQLSVWNTLPDPRNLPNNLVSWCRNAKSGNSVQAQISSAPLIPNYDSDMHRTYWHESSIEEEFALEFGYPGRFVAVSELPIRFRTDIIPATFAKIVATSRKQLRLDFNHPLAGKHAHLDLEIDTFPLEVGSPPLPLDIAALIRDSGYGLQDARIWPLAPSFRTRALARNDSCEDEVFFSKPNLNPFWDKAANTKASRIYQELVADGSRVLDLMAGVHSPLQESAIKPVMVACAGLNPTELAHNPLCTQRLVYNVNSRLALPFPNASFDIVLIHAAIEYLIYPEYMFREIARVLAHEGKIIITFNDRSVTAKSTALWRDLHRLERCALIVDYLTAAGFFANLHGYSSSRVHGIRGQRSTLPVCAVWAERNDRVV